MRQDSALPGVAVGAGGWGLPRIAVNQEPHHCSLFLVVLVVAVDFLVVIMLMLMAIGLVLVLSSVIIVLALVVVSSKELRDGISVLQQFRLTASAGPGR